jgi:phage tail-like protein
LPVKSLCNAAGRTFLNGSVYRKSATLRSVQELPNSASSGTASNAAGLSKVGGLKRTTEVVKHREGGDPSSSRKSPGRTEYDAITLDRGVTHDKEFEQWANKVWNFGSGSVPRSLSKNFRKDIIIELYNEAGQLAIAYKVFRCWVSEFQAQADLDANANAVLIQHIKLENEGWERDYEVPEPSEPTFTEP